MSRLQKSHHTIYSVMGTVLLLTLCLFLCINVIRSIARFRSVKLKEQESKEQYLNLGEMKASLEATLEGSDTPFGIEKTLRETYGYALPGEEVIVVVDDTIVESDPATEKKSGTFRSFFKNTDESNPSQ